MYREDVKCVLSMLNSSGSTYICEQAYSLLKPNPHNGTGYTIQKHLFLLLCSFLGSTAQLRPWPPPQNPAEFLGGFSTIFFCTGHHP
jgi:hypothetical protein